MGAGTSMGLPGYNPNPLPTSTEAMKKIAASRPSNTPQGAKAPQSSPVAPTSTVLTDSLNMESRKPQKRTLLTA